MTLERLDTTYYIQSMTNPEPLSGREGAQPESDSSPQKFQSSSSGEGFSFQSSSNAPSPVEPSFKPVFESPKTPIQEFSPREAGAPLWRDAKPQATPQSFEPIQGLDPWKVPIATEAAASFSSKINFEKNNKKSMAQQKTAEKPKLFTTNRVLAAVVIVIAASIVLDRLPARAPQTANTPPSGMNENLALVGADSPSKSPETTNTIAPNPQSTENKAVITGNSGGSKKIEVYFNNGVLDPKLECSKVFSVERMVTEISPEAALSALFEGPTGTEGDAGYFTSVSPGVSVQSVTVSGGTVTANFGAHLTYNVSTNSCRAKAIRAQIEETLRQFSGVNNVKILVDGGESNLF